MHARSAQSSVVAALALVGVIVGCGSPTAPAADRAAEPDRPAVTKRVVAGVLAPEPTEVWLPGGLGFGPLGETVTAGLGNLDNRGVYFPELAEALPSIENGLWKVFPDGRMETSWTLRQGARWHDGVPITTDDLLFSILVNQDREAFGIGHPGLAFIDWIEAVDARTIRVTWTQPYTGAEQMFSRAAGGNPLAFPWPKHLLEKTLMEDKAAFVQQRFWSTEFVGAGPFKVSQWAQGSYWLLSANDHYVLGRPKVDEIEMRFVGDSQALVAALLSGDIHVTLGGAQAVTPADSLELKRQWSTGRVLTSPAGITPLFPQLLNPTPAIVGNVQFRRALSHAINKEEIASSLLAGLCRLTTETWISTIPLPPTWTGPS